MIEMVGNEENEVIPYACPHWDEQEEQALLSVLRSGTWTNGEWTSRFEQKFAALAGAECAVVSSGTAALHLVLQTIDRADAGPGLLVTPTLNFAAAPAAARLLGWDIAFTDVQADDLTMDPADLREVLSRSRDGEHAYQKIVVVPVHYAGHSCDMTAISDACREFGAELVEDACHAAGASYDDDTPVGSWLDSRAACFSFHPTKPIASGEGGAVCSRDGSLIESIRKFRNHNMSATDSGPDLWPYEIESVGSNHRLSEFHSAIGAVQVDRAELTRRARADIAARYHREFEGLPYLRVVPSQQRKRSSHHLFPVVFDVRKMGVSRQKIVEHYLERRIRCQLHYPPLHRLKAFSDELEARRVFPVMDTVAPGLVSLPMWSEMDETAIQRVIEATRSLVG